MDITTTTVEDGPAAVAEAEEITTQAAPAAEAENPPDEAVVYSFEATTKRVAASGDSFQVVLEMSGQDWLRYVSNQLHKGTNTVLIKPEQLRWTPPPAEKPPAIIECGWDDELQRYRCKNQADALDMPCEHAQPDALTNIVAGQGICLCGHAQQQHYKTTGNSKDGLGQTGCMECVCEMYEEGERSCPNPECSAPFTAAQQRGEAMHKCDFTAARERLGLPAKNGRKRVEPVQP